MIKKFCFIFIFFIYFFCSSFCIYADENNVDMSEWKFTQIISNDQYTISRFYSKNDPNKIAFCVEPDSYFNKNLEYSKEKCEDNTIFNYVKAYYQFGKPIDDSLSDDDKYNYYIATQLLIWEHLTNKEYIFNRDFSKYKENLLNYIDNMNNSNNNQNIAYQSRINEVKVINGDFSNYEVKSSKGIDVLSIDKDGLKYKITELEPLIKTIELTPIYNSKDYSNFYHSLIGQDIYCFDGEYKDDYNINFSITTLNDENEYFDIYYSKKDLEGNNIKGAEFTLYDLNNEFSDDILSFININKNINIYEVLLDSPNSYSNLSIDVSERYAKYISGDYIYTDEIGYFDYKIYNNDQIIKEGRCYVSDDINQTNGNYKNIRVLNVYSGLSEDVDVNIITNIKKNKNFYLCESEPAKGYVYTHNACSLIDSESYSDEIIDFLNDKRTYTLKLMKQSPYDVLLDGAKFKITYDELNETKTLYVTSGYLNIERLNNYKYLIYKYEHDSIANIVEFDGSSFSVNNVDTGKYFYYESNNPEINYEKLNVDYVYVIKGGVQIDNLPYSSAVTIEELEAPKGFMITDPIFTIEPNIKYSEITFRNFRVNEFDILGKKKRKLPKTCIEN